MERTHSNDDEEEGQVVRSGLQNLPLPLLLNVP